MKNSIIKEDIYILGVGHNTIVYIELLETCGYNIAGLLHFDESRIGEKILNYPIIGSHTAFLQNENLEGKNFALSMGDNKIRAALSERIRNKGGKVPTIIHPAAVVSKYSEIDEGVVIHANSVIQPDTSIGKDTVISYNVSVTHTSSIGRSCYLACGSCIGAYVNIGNFVLVGQAASLVSGKVKYIGDNSIIGAGSVVIKDVETNQVVAGNPAKVINNLK